MLIEAPIMADRAVGRAAGEASAMVGPHAVIHAAAVMRERLGENACHAVLTNAQIAALPTGERMIPEVEALRVHRWLAMREPLVCFDIAEEAARRTADYIIANRIPVMAARLLKALPAFLAAPLLMNAIRRHAWTFIGAGRFAPEGGWAFTIDRSGADDPVAPPESLFRWYAAVFERLYTRLVSPTCRCTATPLPSHHGVSFRYRITSG